MIRSATRFISIRKKPNLPPSRLWPRLLSTTRYTKDHEYVRYDDATKIGSVHITKYAQSSLGDIVFAELPQVGTTVRRTAQIGAVESVKAASDIYAPVSGEIVEINLDLDGNPGLMNKEEADLNWLCKIKLSDPSELEGLLSESEYKDHCESES